ncbi:MAG: spermidine synthase [Kiritimatiellia bacterium]
MTRHGALPTIFLGSFLLFGLQPLTGKTLLPILGGSAGVWLICLGLFQTLLLAGYLYAHLYTARNPLSRPKILCHAGLVLTAGLATFLILAPNGKTWLEQLPESPLGVALAVLLLSGASYVLLSANSSLVQSWVSHTSQRRDVYWLYGLSNAGSLLSLLLYPLAIEPYIPLQWQWKAFGILLALYGASLLQFINARPGTCPTKAPEPGTQKGGILLWIALPALSTLLLNATTLHLMSDVSPMPLLWTLTLAAFLASWMVGFTPIAEKAIHLLALLALIAAGYAGYCSTRPGEQGFLLNLCAAGALLLPGCAFLHAWIYASRPTAERLTLFYLCLAAGGAIGGAFASFLAPVLFDSIAEYPLALGGLSLAAASLLHSRSKWVWAGCAGALFLAARPFWQPDSLDFFYARRNAYGVSRVANHLLSYGPRGTFKTHLFLHGSTWHGMQIWDNDFYRLEPTLYHTSNAVGKAVSTLPAFTNGAPLRVAVLGMGAGVCTVYGRTNDLYRCYEINPQVVDLATNSTCFTFVRDAQATVEIAVQDARQGLAREVREHEPLYDLIILDVYSGDSIPLHLATREAFDLFLSRLKPGGTIALHLTNWHLDLLRLCRAVRDELHLQVRAEQITGDRFGSPCVWCYLNRGEAPLPSGGREIDLDRVKQVPLMTDERCSLLPFISFSAQELPFRENNAFWDKLFAPKDYNLIH